MFLAGGVFKLELFLPDDYPMTPPKIRFLTKIFHPNVDKLGRICLDVLKSMYPSRAKRTWSIKLLTWNRQLVARTADPNNPPFHPGATRSAQPR